jgi:hypothetical protein
MRDLVFLAVAMWLIGGFFGYLCGLVDGYKRAQRDGAA